MDVESLAKLVFCYLKNCCKPSDNHPAVVTLRKHLEKRYGHSFDYDDLLEAVTLLERRGLVMRSTSNQPREPDQYNNKAGLRDFAVYLTSIGIKSKIDEGVILLVDKPEEIVRKLEQKVQNLDPVIRQYYLESLRAYQEGLYISSVICLGAASERSIRWLAESIDPYAGAYQQEIRQRRDGKIYRLIDYLSNTVIPNTFDDKKFKEKLKERLNGLGNVYRENRNDAGHPDTIEQTSWLGEDQEVLLLQFRRYITTICEAIGRLK